MSGAQLMEALRRYDPSLEFFGVAGERMRASGCDTVVDAKELSVVGITEILSHLPKIWGLFRKLIIKPITAGQTSPSSLTLPLLTGASRGKCTSAESLSSTMCARSSGHGGRVACGCFENMSPRRWLYFRLKKSSTAIAEWMRVSSDTHLPIFPALP